MALTFICKIIPSSGKQLYKLNKSKQLVCYLKNQPEKQKANKELISSLANCLRLPQTAITILNGLSSRHKTIKIDADITYQKLLAALGIEDGQQSFL